MNEISDERFVRDMRIIWQNSELEIRNKLSEIIWDYFDKGNRAAELIGKMQVTLSDKDLRHIRVSICIFFGNNINNINLLNSLSIIGLLL